MDKKVFRNLYKKKRSEIPNIEIVRLSRSIFEKITASEEFENANKIFTYVNFENEIVTEDIINYSLSLNKIVAVPVINGKEMFFSEIKSLSELKKNKFGILEPESNALKITECDEKTLVLVPLLAYNSKKQRIGYGGGYYDKFIAANNALCFMGLGFEWQRNDELPTEIHDMALDMIVTEKKFII